MSKTGSDNRSHFSVTIPNPICRSVDEVPDDITECKVEVNVALSQKSVASNNTTTCSANHFIPLEKYSNFSFMINVYKNILKFINKLKLRIQDRTSSIPVDVTEVTNFHSVAFRNVIQVEQKLRFPDVF